ncbi:hypothetical protein [Acinetobacter sp. WCHAc010052]|uniref:hypothetical protein n=1 Tax=Acinetobacter sp. WCHAc010052 TaxID=2004647 RepID=UPI000B3CA830|nr:hypothetical protein [Acinetobacter sp. WCHAc010052]AXY59485.1 hypothetical protein CDG61_05240 [Acinetobacter sp. WCHAc010052]
MYLLRDDPIVEEIRGYYNNLEEFNDSEEEFIFKIKKLFSDNKIVEVSAYTLKGIEIFPNNLKIKLLNFDALLRLGFFLDAQQAIEKCFFLERSKNILVFERIFELYLRLIEYDKLIDLCQSNIQILLKSERASRQYMDFLIRTRNYEHYDYIFENHKEIILEILGNPIQRVIFDYKKYKVSDLIHLQQSYSKLDFEKIMDIIWRLYHQGERSLLFFKNACKTYEGEVYTGPRQIFFNRLAYLCFPDEVNFLLEYTHNLVFNKYYENTYYFLKKISIKGIICNPLVNEYQRNRLYYFTIKLNSLVQDEDKCLITYDQALKFNLIKPYSLDFCRQYSLALKAGISTADFEQKIRNFSEKTQEVINFIVFKISQIVSDDKNEFVDLNLVGQMRGGLNSVNDINELISNYNFKKVFFSTWNIQPVFPPRLYSLRRILGISAVRLLPEPFRHFGFFQQKFPMLSKKIFSSEGIELNLETLSKINTDVEYRIVDEKAFNTLYESQQGFLIGSRLHQAKMFYHFYHSIPSFSGARVVLRKRPDMKNHIKFDMSDHFKVLSKHDNYLYTNYFDHNLGFCDRFSLGSQASIKKIGMIWETALHFNKLIYADFFDDYTHLRAAEHLMSSHIVACGIKTRYIHCQREEFIESDNLGEIPLKSEFLEDFSALSDEEKGQLSKFYNYMIETLS